MKIVIENADENDFNELAQLARKGRIHTFYMADEDEGWQGEWIDYNNTFYKCPDCGYLLEKCCPQCQNKVILPKGGAE